MASQHVLYIIGQCTNMKIDDGTRTKYYKVGITKNIVTRLSDHQTGNPLLLKVDKMYTFPTALYAETVEKVVLKKLKQEKYIMRSEWIYTEKYNELEYLIDSIVMMFEKLVAKFEQEVEDL